LCAAAIQNVPSVRAQQTAAAGEEPNLQLQSCLSTMENEHMKLTPSSMKLDRNQVDVSTPVLARYWRKRLRKSQQEIEAAIAKVGGNAETVMKELRVTV